MSPKANKRNLNEDLNSIAGATGEIDVASQVKVQMMEHRLNVMQQKVEGLNPVFLLTMETRLEDLHNDLIELRNLYSSPTSSLNLVLDGLLKKVKDLEASEIKTGRSSPQRIRGTHMGSQQLPTSVGSPRTVRNETTNYR